MTGLFRTPSPRDPALPRAVRVGIVGSGSRARTMLRVLDALPEWFAVAGVATRDAGDRELLSTQGFSVFATLDELLHDGTPDFVALTLSADDAQALVARLAEARVPVLTQTPAAGSVQELLALHALVEAGACIQVAEQYHLEPLVAAQLRVAASGRLGPVTDAQVSIAHEYHGLAVLRRALGVTFEEPLVTARRDDRRVLPSPSPYADPSSMDLVETVHATAWLDYGDRLGTYEFDDVQYRSWVRSPTIVLRGPYGELRDELTRWVGGDGKPRASRLERVSAGGAGNHEGMFLRGYTLDGGWVQRNDFRPARLPGDELAIAEVFAQMGRHVLAGGTAPYDVAEAAQDQYLTLAIRESADRDEPVRATRQPWSDNPGCRH